MKKTADCRLENAEPPPFPVRPVFLSGGMECPKPSQTDCPDRLFYSLVQIRRVRFRSSMIDAKDQISS